MKFIIYTVIILLAATGLAIVAQQDSGYIMINFRGWTIETSFIVFATAFILTFLALYVSFRLLIATGLLPRKIRRWRHDRNTSLGRSHLTQGLMKLNAGEWQDAEKLLIKSARNDDLAALAYMGAARAAQAQEENGRRDKYLQLAHQSSSENQAALSFAEAQLKIESGDTDKAIAILKQLPAKQRNTPQALKLLARLYLDLKDWPALVALLPSLRRYKVFPLYNFYEIEQQAYIGLLNHTAHTKDAEALQDLWLNLPKRLQEREEMVLNYSCALINCGKTNEAEELLYRRLNKQWSDSLVYIYGLLDSDAEIHLSRARNWLKKIHHNPVLLLTLGRLAMRAHQWQEARNFLEESLKITPNSETYKELGNLLAFLNEQGTALECYRRGLTLASGSFIDAKLHSGEVEKIQLPRPSPTLVQQKETVANSPKLTTAPA